MPGYGDKTTTTKTGKKTTWWLYGSARQPEGEVRVQWWVQKKSKTFDLQNLTISPTSPNVGSCQICQKNPTMYSGDIVLARFGCKRRSGW